MGGGQDVTDSVFYREFGAIMMEAPVIGLEFTRYLPVVIVPYALLQACAPPLNPLLPQLTASGGDLLRRAQICLS